MYAQSLLELGTRAGVSSALNGCLVIASIDGSNTQNGQNAREHVPAHFLRLGRDKECYDFLKEKCVGDLGEIYACDNVSLRHLQSTEAFIASKLPTELSDQIYSCRIGAATKIDASRMKAIEKREDLSTRNCSRWMNPSRRFFRRVRRRTRLGLRRLGR